MTSVERRLWKGGLHHVAGVDEVGAGPLAGPVVAAAVVMPPEVMIPFVNDSKKLSLKRREALEVEIKDLKALAYSLGFVHRPRLMNSIFTKASREAMRRAVRVLISTFIICWSTLRSIPGCEDQSNGHQRR